MYWLFHVICIFYCLWRLRVRYNKVSTDGVTGISPGLDTIMVIFLAPILAIIDVIVSWVTLVIKYHNQK